MKAVRQAALHDVATIEREVVDPSRIKAGTLFVGLENIEPGGRFVGVRPVESGELASSKFAFTPSHVLYGKLRPYLAKIARPDFAGICSTDILPVLSGPELDRDYLAWLLLTPAMVSLAASRATGANLPRLSPNALAQMRIPLPPLPEQRRIAEILDKADALRAKRRAALKKLDELTQSIFLDMFGDPVSNPRGWPIQTVAGYVREFQGGRSIEADADEDAPTRNRVLKVSAVTSGVFIPNESKPVPDSYVPPQEHFVRGGDLLFSRANTTELVGAVAYVYRTPTNTLLPDKLWRFVWRDRDHVEPLFVWALFRTSAVRYEIGRRATGTSGSMKNISQQKVLGIPIIYPSVDVQRAFVQRFREVHTLQERHRLSTAHGEELLASLQNRAFRGEL